MAQVETPSHAPPASSFSSPQRSRCNTSASQPGHRRPHYDSVAGGSFVSELSDLLGHVGRPEPDEEPGNPVGVFGGSLIMINTVVGGGISLVATPFALRELGLIPFMAAELLFAMGTVASMTMIGSICHRTDCYDLMDVTARYLGPKSAKVLGAAVFLNTFGIVTSFIQIAFDACSAFGSFDRWVSYAVIGGLLLITARLSWAEHVRGIERLASVCLLLWVVFVGMVVVHFLQAAATPGALAENWTQSRSLTDVLVGKGLASINLTWTCQFNAAPLFSSLAPREVGPMRRVSVVMSGVAVVIYLMFGCATYLFFGDNIDDDVMASFSAKTGGPRLLWGAWSVYTLELLLGMSVILTIPFFMIEGRTMFNNVLFRRHVERGCSESARIAETLGLIAACYALAALTDGHLGFVLAATGILANILQWFVPGLITLRAARDRGDQHDDALGCSTAAAYALIAFGACITVSGVFSLFVSEGATPEAPHANATAGLL
eukprot:TRINITY_DN32339_c0_g1_i1.p1 TRINITY_DN32339_c0_g1~~TRINITY_DN32339_c0_g1_i1.p1  ORF type:complete len:515 (+),score=154.20 TRINITY_DN32339_c0_g1_i1:74-1546(+)